MILKKDQEMDIPKNLKNLGDSVIKPHENFIVNEINDSCLRLAVNEGEFPWHYHSNFDEWFIVLKGELTIEFHAWCFIPHFFRLVIHYLFNLGLISLKDVDFHPTRGCEFYITLGREGKGINKTRLEMLKIIESEIKDMPSLTIMAKILKKKVQPFYRKFYRKRRRKVVQD